MKCVQDGEVRRLRRLDLNLLVALDCLLVERGVSKAARRLGVSQSTASDALARLRRHFDDPLLQGSPRRYELSPLAQRLRAAVAEAVTAADRVFAGMPDFVPDADAVQFRVVGSEHALLFAGTALSRAVSGWSHGSRLLLEAHSHDDDAATRLRENDGLLLSDGVLPDGAQRIDVGTDRIVVVRAAGSEPVETMAALQERPWVVYSEHGMPVDRLPSGLLHPRVEIDVPSALSVPFYLEDTDRLALLPMSLAQRAAQGSRIEMSELPVPMPPLRIAFWWHPSRAADPAHAWLRRIVRTFAH